ncbi:MAG: hypothetical protein HY558_04115 [Euryarchaeota archaeon]|nr:hypothetical protein [Euryarchaeota archaeon]
MEDDFEPAPPTPRGTRRLCPVCGGDDLHYFLGGYEGTTRYQCKGCDYVGPYVIEGDEETARVLREQYAQRRG